MPKNSGHEECQMSDQLGKQNARVFVTETQNPSSLHEEKEDVLIFKRVYSSVERVM